MKIACLSGKGGAGKTLTAVNLAAAAGRSVYIDCDVEEPNGRLFLKPEKTKEKTVYTLLPEFHTDLCTGCKKCVDFCRFHALVYIKEKPMVFSEVCHSCGGCRMVCPEDAITEKAKPVGILEFGKTREIRVVTGILNLGEASGVLVIRDALKQAGEEDVVVIDCPPGSACSVMESVMDADFCILVVEPTAFGFHNFKMVYELVSLLKKKCGVLINKQDIPYAPLESFCRENEIPILARIPFDPQIAALAAEGKVISWEMEEMHNIFTGILRQIGGIVHETSSDPQW